MSIDVGRRLGFGVLEPAEQILGILQAQANGLESVIALAELQDHLIPDHGIIIADNAKLKLNAQGHAGLSTNSVWSIGPSAYLPLPAQTTQCPTVPDALSEHRSPRKICVSDQAIARDLTEPLLGRPAPCP